MIVIKTLDEIKLMRRANRIVAEVLSALRDMVRPGVTTADLEEEAEKRLEKSGAEAAFKGYPGAKGPFPSVLCASVNEEVVHGIPTRRRVLEEGDIISLDFGAIWKGYYGDAAVTVPVGKVIPEAEKLIRVTEEALIKAVEQVKEGNRLDAIGKAVQTHVESNGFSVVRQFVGHGIGRRMHEDPQIPNFVELAAPRPRLKEGMVLAIEPMVNAGGWAVRVLDDGWTAVTEDGSLSAHFEHSVAVSADGPEVLSAL